MVRPYKHLQTLAILVMRDIEPILDTQPSVKVLSRPSATLTSKVTSVNVKSQKFSSDFAILTSTFKSKYCLDVKSKFVSLNGKTLKNIFYHLCRPSNSILATQSSKQVLFRPDVTLTSKAKMSVSMVRPLKYLETLTLIFKDAM